MRRRAEAAEALAASAKQATRQLQLPSSTVASVWAADLPRLEAEKVAAKAACEAADAALRKRLGRRIRRLDRDMDSDFQQALARLQTACVNLDGARRPINWDD